jgi:hypothetical protein
MAAPGTTNIRQFAVRRLPVMGLLITGEVPELTPGPSAGTGVLELSLDARDMAGTIILTPGGAPAPSDVVCSLRFTNALKLPPKGVRLQGVSAAAAALAGNAQVYPDAASFTAGGFVLRAGSTPLQVGALYAWFYEVTG